MTALKSSLIITAALLLGGAVVMASQTEKEVFIQSFESKTHEGHPVFNKISLAEEKYQDIWTMRQSHEGPHAWPDDWDTIRIVVNKKSRPYRVSYQQFEKGQEIELKASCYTCHANGPRAIRPDYDSQNVTYTILDRFAIAGMNLKMKLYGRVEIEPTSFALNGKIRSVPLKYFSKTDTMPLEVKSCTFCHHNGFMGRGELTRQHSGTIKHLVMNKEMPPWPFSLTKDDEKEIEQFVKDR